MPRPATNRFTSLGSRDGRKMAMAMEQQETEADAGRSGNKVGAWASIRRKMSMHRLKPEKGRDVIASSAMANLKSLPPPMVHTISEVGPVPQRPNIMATRSANTLPTRTAFGTTNEFGQNGASPISQPMPTSNLPSSSSLFGATGGSVPRRGKRKSFLPIDGPPLLTVTIPQGSPFDEDAQLEAPPTPAKDSDEKPLPPPGDAPDSEEQEERYAHGLEVIKSYLRDLHDLSRPPIEPYGGFEVIPNTESNYAPSMTNSDNLGSTTSYHGASIADVRRGRRPTIERTMSCANSTNSAVTSDKGSFHESDEFAGKKLKDDKAKRARLIREILETERTYVAGLQELMAIYVFPSAYPVNGPKPIIGQKPANSRGGETIIPASERKIVFGGVEPILQIHAEHFLPALERTITPLLRSKDEDGESSMATAQKVGEVFRTYIAYMKQYSTYTNNFENALSRMRMWSASSSQPGPLGSAKPSPSMGVSSAAISAGVGAGLGSISPTIDASAAAAGSAMTAAQRKRVKAFLKAARKEKAHSQISLESYLLLPIQRVPRYKMLLEQLAMATPPRGDGQRDALDDAYNEIASLASLMNEEKRDADSRLKLFQWQQRIFSRGPSPLVQPHRKLVLDGALNLIRVVKKASVYVEVDGMAGLADGESTITMSKSVVPVEYIAQEPMNHPIMLVLCTDLLVLVQQAPGQEGWDGQVDLFNVLRMGTVHEPANVAHGNVLRVVDNKVGSEIVSEWIDTDFQSIYYFQCPSADSALSWSRAINSARRR